MFVLDPFASNSSSTLSHLFRIHYSGDKQWKRTYYYSTENPDFYLTFSIKNNQWLENPCSWAGKKIHRGIFIFFTIGKILMHDVPKPHVKVAVSQLNSCLKFVQFQLNDIE